MTVSIQPTPLAPPEDLPKDHYRLQTSKLAGSEYYIERHQLEDLKIGNTLNLVAEPANPYDKYAVRIHWNDLHIGYLPRSSNHVVSRLLRQGCSLTAQVAYLNLNSDIALTLHVLMKK